METAGATHRVGPDLTDLAEAALAPGPAVSLYLATPGAVENARHELGVRWRGARAELARQGAPDEVLDAIDPVVDGAHAEGDGLAVIAGHDGVRHASYHSRPPDRELARWSCLPSLVPLLSWRQADVPYVLVVADRVGADIVGVRPGLDHLAAQGGGGEFPVRKPQGGGWSQRRYQERAEVTWEHNAQDVAHRVTRFADLVDARLVVVAGDTRAVNLVQDSLPEGLRQMCRAATGGRSPDGSTERLADQVARHVADVVAADTEALLATFVEEASQGDRASVGPDATLAALARAQVDVLFVHDEADDERVAWFGPEPTQVARQAPDVGAMGVDEPWRGRLVDVAVRAALGTGATIRVVEQGAVEGGCSAVLRWSE
jgi:peptide subunit release factor 1 (eRF1)